MKKIVYIMVLLLAVHHLAVAQLQQDICEKVVPQQWKAKNGKLTISNQHQKMGEHAIAWNWTKGNLSTLNVVSDEFKKVVDDKRSTFVIWIYNETPVSDKLSFTFYAEDKAASQFDFNLNFKGWRTAWVMYHRDMQGTPIPNMNRLEIKAPATLKKGTLYLDQMMYQVNINPRSPMRDFQVPFVNLEGDKAANSHWNSLYKFSTTPDNLPLKASVSTQDKQEVKQIYKRFLEVVLPSKKVITDADIAKIEKEYAFWKIKKSGSHITGRTIFSVNDIELFDENRIDSAKKINAKTNINRYSNFMFSVAEAYHFSSIQTYKDKLAILFMNLLDHAENQGWSFGSGMGALHHLGYNLENYYTACLLMKDVIKASGKLEQTFKSMFWFSGLGRAVEVPEKMPESNIDVLNTLLQGMLSSILILDDTPEKMRFLQYYSHWLSFNMKPNVAITGAFKPDGAVFHHATLYPAYGVGGYNGLAPIVYVLSKTNYQVEQEAHQKFKENLLMMHYYTNPYKWPISISGRHPTGTWSIPDKPYAYMALAGTPDGKEAIDKEMAAVYLLVSKKKSLAWEKKFNQTGVQAAKYPNGHWDLNYGLLAIHRRNNWLLTVKGHNRYMVSHEAYPKANVFGRYLNYGHLEVLFPETPSFTGSNFADKGWDWNRIPGATTLHVPLDKLRAHILNVDDYSGVEEMLLTDEVFAGGISLNQQGFFAMKLRGHDKYNLGSFKAIKSWFMFDSLVVCLGSDIENSIKEYPTETTIFQNYLGNTSEAVIIDNQQVNYPQEIVQTLKSPGFVVDNRGIGYYLAANSKISLSKNQQKSRDQKDTQNTQGNFASLVLQHGYAPQKDAYEYAMLIGADAQKMQTFKTQMSGKTPVYQVLQKNAEAHSVKYIAQQLTGLALFKANSQSTDPLIINNNKACLILYQPEAEKLNLAITDPDLGFYQGEDETPLNSDGTRKEVSIYSRYWFKTDAQPSVVVLKLKGIWQKADEQGAYELKKAAEGNTLIKVNCAYGLATRLTLKKGN
jgi:chondroitin-sulfate-ABC endolyase/exolyase